MTIDDADDAPRQLEGEVESPEGKDAPRALEGEVSEPAPDARPDDEQSVSAGKRAVVGEYTWDDFLREHGEPAAAAELYARFDEAPGSDRWGEVEEDRTITEADWARTDVDPVAYLGFPPWKLEARLAQAHLPGEVLTASSPLIGYDETPVIKDIYGWEDYKRRYFYDEEGNPPTDDEGEPEAFDAADALGFDPERIGEVMADCKRAAEEMLDLEEKRTVDVAEDVDEDAFFSDASGRTTVVNRYDLEKTVPMSKKAHFVEEDRYWVNEPYSFVVIFHSTKENEKKYYVVEPHRTEIETDLTTFLTDKLRTAIKYDEEGTTVGDEDHRRSVIEERSLELLDRYGLYEGSGEGGGGMGNLVADALGLDPDGGVAGRLVRALGYRGPTISDGQLDGIAARPEPAVLEEDADTLTEYQVEKLLYYLERDFIGYERIDGVKHDINVEDVSCDGYDSPVFVYHSDYEQIISNVYHGRKELDDFVVKLAQRSGKGISKRRPQVDATLPDGSRAQLTLGREVSDHGTNYTIRQFKDVPFTPLDLINWQTFSLDEMAFLWLCIENHKSLIFAGGTASGKTTSLNAVSLFIPSNTKIVSIEDTREVELPQRNWIASVTRPSFSDDDKGDIDEFDLLEAALRQRPDYIVMGEIRGEEGRTLFQVMSTGHTTYTTFHADSVGEVLKRFTTDPINVSKTMFTALDLVSIQTSTRVQGRKVRRNKSLTEINHYDAENDEINVQDVYQWQAETDEFLLMSESNTLDDIMFDRGWSRETLDGEIFQRQVVLAYLIYNGLNTYTQVAATFQAFINDPETILSLMANDLLESSLEDLREMESVLIDIDPEKEEMVPRPDPNEKILAECRAILDRAEEELFAQFRGDDPDSVADALGAVDYEPDVDPRVDAAGELPEGGPDERFDEPHDAEADEAPDRTAIDDGSGDDYAELETSVDPSELTAAERSELEGDDDDETPALEAGDDESGADDAGPAGDESSADVRVNGAAAGDAETDDSVGENWRNVLDELDRRDAAKRSDAEAGDPGVGGGGGDVDADVEDDAAGPEDAAAPEDVDIPEDAVDDSEDADGADDGGDAEDIDAWGFGDVEASGSEEAE